VPVVEGAPLAVLPAEAHVVGGVGGGRLAQRRVVVHQQRPEGQGLRGRPVHPPARLHRFPPRSVQAGYLEAKQSRGAQPADSAAEEVLKDDGEGRYSQDRERGIRTLLRLLKRSRRR
jgi:hypothetical protein